jgi:truncated hemoglobin YjbI
MRRPLLQQESMSMSAEPNCRVTLSDEISERTGITEALIAELVDTFYGRVRLDPMLAPAFARVGDWDAHLAKLRAFWSSVTLMSGRYHGQPMQAHFPLSIELAHFDRCWRCSSRPLRMSAIPMRRSCSWRKRVGLRKASKWPLPPKTGGSQNPSTDRVVSA